VKSGNKVQKIIQAPPGHKGFKSSAEAFDFDSTIWAIEAWGTELLLFIMRLLLLFE
jgi:hypothetical protein